MFQHIQFVGKQVVVGIGKVSEVWILYIWYDDTYVISRILNQVYVSLKTKEFGQEKKLL